MQYVLSERSGCGHPAAVTQFAVYYDEGIGVNKSPTKATVLIRQAAEAGDPYGMSYYSWTKLNGHHTDVNFALAYKFVYKAEKKVESTGLWHVVIDMVFNSNDSSIL